MKKEVISDKQAIVLIALFVMGSTLVLGTGMEAKQDVWVAIITALVGGLLAAFLYSRILLHFQGEDLFIITSKIFGKYIGNVVNLLYIWYALHLGALVLRNFGEFIVTVSLEETPILVPMFFLTILCVWGVKEGIEVLGRWSEFFIVILLGVISFIAILTIPNWEFENLLPVLSNGFSPLLKGAFSAFTFPFGETVVFIMILSSLKWEKSVFKVYSSGLICAGLIAIYILTRNIMTLGVPGVEAAYFPSYIAVARVNVGNFIQRLEITVSLVFVVAGFIKISICLLAACKGVATVFKCDDYRFLVFPVGLLMLVLSYIIYPNIMEMVRWAFEIYPYYALWLQVIIPIFILIVIEIRIRIKRNHKKKILDS